jgi:Mn2+/Fe2+ NRAMP family transporter
MPTSTYYDSCIFLTALNTTHRQHKACAAITTPERISWVVWVCRDLIGSETTATELVNAFEVGCAFAGVIVAHANLDEARALAAKHKTSSS